MTVLKWTRIHKAEYDKLTETVQGQGARVWRKAGLMGLRMKPEGSELRYYAAFEAKQP